MQLETKELDYCKLEALYEADPQTVSSLRDEVVADLRGVQIPGFRKGKAPDYAIKSKLKKLINNQLTLKLSDQAYDDLIFEKNIKVIGRPSFDEVNLNGDKFSCKLTVVTKPDFELKDYKYEVPAPDVDRDVTGRVEKLLQDLRLNFGDVRPFDDGEFVNIGDQITMDFNATIDGEAFEGSMAEGQLYVVGNNDFSEFDDAILGMAPGEVREFDITFPESFPNIGGKQAHFSVTVHMGTKKVPHALDDELAKKCGMENLIDLNEKLSKIEDNKIKQTVNMSVREQIINRIVEDNDFRVPDVLVDMEAQYSAMRNGLDWFALEESERDSLKTHATKSVRLSMILDSIREKEPDAVLNDSEAISSLKTRAELHGQDANKTVVEAQKNGSLFGMISALKDEFTVQWLVDQAKIIE